MGGGGSRYSDYDTENALKKLEESKRQTQNAEMDSQVSEIINDILKDCNNRNVDQIQKHLESIKNALEKEIEGSVDLIFGGSISKHTYVDGLSDADSLVILDNCELANEKPQSAKEYIAERLKDRFPNTHIAEGDLAVKVNFKDIEIQLVPAVRCNDETTISNSKGNKWLNIKPEEFAKALTRVNKENNGKVVPMIKIAKVINSKLPQNQQLKSYHIESLAIEAFKNYRGEKKTKQMLQHFFNDAASRVINRIKDKTGQTIHVDDYLGENGSAERRLVANSLNRISRKMSNADKFNSIEEWENILK